MNWAVPVALMFLVFKFTLLMVEMLDVPVAVRFVKFPVPELRVFIFPVEADNVCIIAVAKDKIFPRIFVTVVEASVEDPDTIRFVFDDVAEIVVDALVVEEYIVVRYAEPVALIFLELRVFMFPV